MDVAFVSEFVGDRRYFRFVSPNHGPVAVDASDPLEESYCYYVAHGFMPQRMPNPADDPIATSMPVTHELPVGAHLSIPIRLNDGSIYGTICCFSFTPDASLDERSTDQLRLCGDIVGGLVDKLAKARRTRDRARKRVERVVRGNGLTVFFQPSYRLDDDRLAAFEALPRFKLDPAKPIAPMLQEAAETGLSLELERLVLEEACATLAALPDNVFAFVAASAAALEDRRFADTIEAARLDRLVLTLSEPDVFERYGTLKALSELRQRGLRLMIAGVGAERSSYRVVETLKPEFIKLDPDLVRSIDADVGRRVQAESIVGFARRAGCAAIASDVASAAELAILRSIGVAQASGTLFGAALPAIAALSQAGRAGRGSADAWVALAS